MERSLEISSYNLHVYNLPALIYQHCTIIHRLAIHVALRHITLEHLYSYFTATFSSHYQIQLHLQWNTMINSDILYAKLVNVHSKLILRDRYTTVLPPTIHLLIS